MVKVPRSYPRAKHTSHGWHAASPLQSCPTLRPLQGSPPGSSAGDARGKQAGGVLFPFSRASSWPGAQIQVSRSAGRHTIVRATREVRTDYSQRTKQNKTNLRMDPGFSIIATLRKMKTAKGAQKGVVSEVESNSRERMRTQEPRRENIWRTKEW